VNAHVLFPHAGPFPARNPLRGLRESVGNWSLLLRLGVFFAAFLAAAWLLAAFFAWRENRISIDRFFDTQQTNFAKMLLTVGMDAPPQALPKTGPMLHGFDKKARGAQDKNAIGFALFDRRGVLLLHDGEEGRYFTYDGRTQGFADTVIGKKGKDNAWRMFRLASPDGERIAAVGQEIKYRQRLVLTTLARQMLPWFFLVPLLLVGLLWMLHRELLPLQAMSARLRARSPQDSSPLETAGIPPEVRPLVTELNGFFGRAADMRRREQAFVADAAHELRTPLAGLRVQAEVVELSDDDPGARRHALAQIRVSIDRCNRLVEQLLTLSRLETLLDEAAGGEQKGLFPFAPLDWPALLEETLGEFRAQAEDKRIALQCVVRTLPARSMGAPSLMAILLRNLLDNAVKYTPDNGSIGVTLDSHALTVENSGPGIPDACLARLGERFFRPPGQEVSGSGLGLSIVKQLAGLHGFLLLLQNREPGVDDGSSGFVAGLLFGNTAGITKGHCV
jgi:two-component system sensor histidine kinase QseC